MQNQKRRKKKIIKPELQWRLMIVFTILAISASVMQAIVLGTTLVIVSDRLPNDGNLLYAQIETLVWISLGVTALFVVPLNLLVARTITFKVAGPLYRFEVHLRRIIAGERPGTCRIRKDDELHDFCQILNEALAPLSTPQAEETATDGEGLDESAPVLPAASEAQAPLRAG